MTTGTALRPMTEAEFAAWREQTVPAYAADKVAAGQWTPAESLALSAAAYDELLPRGLATPGHHLRTVVDADGAAVGVLWHAEESRAGARIAYVYDIAIEPQRQREGHARRALLALEAEARRRGLAGIGLHVFGHNPGAQALYARLGFAPTSISLFKALPGAPVADAARHYAIKAPVADTGAARFVFAQCKTMYGGKRIARGDTVYVFASENSGGPGFVARGVVAEARALARDPALGQRQTPRVSIVVERQASATRAMGRAQLKAFADWGDGRPETELNFKFYRQATDKIVGISGEAARFLEGCVALTGAR